MGLYRGSNFGILPGIWVVLRDAGLVVGHCEAIGLRQAHLPLETPSLNPKAISGLYRIYRVSQKEGVPSKEI